MKTLLDLYILQELKCIQKEADYTTDIFFFFLEFGIHLTTTPGMAIPHVLLQISHLLQKTCHPHAPPVCPGNKEGPLITTSL